MVGEGASPRELTDRGMGSKATNGVPPGTMSPSGRHADEGPTGFRSMLELVRGVIEDVPADPLPRSGQAPAPDTRVYRIASFRRAPRRRRRSRPRAPAGADGKRKTGP